MIGFPAVYDEPVLSSLFLLATSEAIDLIYIFPHPRIASGISSKDINQGSSEQSDL
jgi:hypothetical protein